ncbi:hypothetical protein JB92DRAFT_2039331 [Gautieria morchelliformis]|nr:hypothetical protein JB92DRAFT_2039331 [Gautieria morchelliformis]
MVMAAPWVWTIHHPSLDPLGKITMALWDPPEEVTALRQEVKSVKDANKVLSLYANNIIGRIIIQEGFEHVFAVDYGPDKASPTPKSPGAFKEVLAEAKPPTQPKARPQTMLLSCSSSTVTSGNLAQNFFRFPTSGKPEKLMTFSNSPPSPAPDVKRNRRSLSLSDWKPLGMFGGGTPPVKVVCRTVVWLYQGRTRVMGQRAWLQPMGCAHSVFRPNFRRGLSYNLRSGF